MSVWEWARAIAIVGPIGLMLVLGLFLALRSGISPAARGATFRRLMENGSQTMLLLSGYLVGLVVIQRIVGLPVALAW